MAEKNSTNRFPAWLIYAAGLLVLLFAAGLLAILFQDLSSPVEPEAVEERFSEHLAFMKELAFEYPGHVSFVPPDPSKEEEVNAWKKSLEVWKAWSAKSNSRPDLFDDPAIKGAKITIFDAWEGRRVGITIKKQEDLEPSWLESLAGVLGPESTKPDLDRPAVRQWRAGNKDLILYENRFLDPEGVKMGCRLLVDISPARNSR